MLIDYVSDVHVSHYVPFTPSQEKWATATKKWTRELLTDKEGEVFIVAGDISEWNQQIKWFLEEASLHYERVFFVFGNHDYYLLSNNQLDKYGNSINKEKELVESVAHLTNVVHLDGFVSVYKDISIAGHSMWYNLPTPEDKAWYKANSNDSLYVYGEGGRGNSYKELYEKSIWWYEKMEALNVHVMVSHFPPVNPPSSNQNDIAAYRTDVPYLLGKHWVCGHQHIQEEFKVLDTKFHMNPLGYPSEKLTKTIKSFKV